MADNKSHWHAAAGGILAGLALGFLLSPVRNGVRVDVNICKGPAKEKKRVFTAGVGCRADMGEKKRNEDSGN